ncbi:MAG: hypothetical protein HY898_00275 [Deltaproteobacteria bacterium]|nr:hypothetical protein [Deltaproteobacteria bacterium]
MGVAITAIASLGCSDAGWDTPDGGQDDAEAAEGATADALPAPDAATDSGADDQAMVAGCSVAVFQPGSTAPTPVGIAAVAALCALGALCRKRRRALT